MKRFSSVVLFVSVCLSPVGAVAVETTKPALSSGPAPGEIVMTIYKTSAGKKGDYQGRSAFEDAQIRRKYFSADLIRRLKAIEKSPEPVIDFDPITASQDPNVKELAIKPESESADSAVVSATFKSFQDPRPEIVRYEFIRESGAWRLDNISGTAHGGKGERDTSWSLRDILKNAKRS